MSLWLFLLFVTGFARNNTYCVGGYNSCQAQRTQHLAWHHHSNLIGPNGGCWSCFDELDDSCDDDFLRNNPGWTKRSTRQACPQPNAPVYQHKIAGREVSPPRPKPVPRPVAPEPPPPPPPVKYTPVISRVSAGPYAAGDEVVIYGAVTSPKGSPGVKSGTVLVTANGQTASFSARAQPDGTVPVKIKLPPGASSVSVVFVPDLHPLEPHESLTTPRSSARTLQVATCPYRVSVAKPVKGTTVQVGTVLQLEPSVRAVGQGGTPSRLDLTWTIVPPDAAPLTVKSDASGKATWSVPPDLSDQTVSISVGGKADGQLACSAGERILPVSKLGLGWNTQDLPEECSIDQPCKGTAKLMLPEDPKSRADLEKLLADPATKVTVIAGGQRTTVAPSPDHTYTFQTTPKAEGSTYFRMEITTPTGGTLSVTPHEVNVTPGLKLVLPPEIDFGTVQAGTAWHEVCRELDYGQSVSWEGNSWKLQVEGADDCEGEPVLMYANAWGQPSKASLLGTVETDPHHELRPIHDICLSTSGCASEVAPEVFLVVTPLDPKFADQVKKVRLKWEIQGTSWLWCWGWMLIPIPILLFILFVLYGFFRPHRFPPHAAIRIASKPGDLKRNAAITLRDLPGSGSGWYRDARLGLHRSGEVTKQVAGAVVVLRASKRDVLLDPSVPLEARNRRNGRYEPVQPIPTGAVPNTIYRAGDVYFRVEV